MPAGILEIFAGWASYSTRYIIVDEKRMIKTRKKIIIVKISFFLKITRLRSSRDPECRAYRSSLNIDSRRNILSIAKSFTKTKGKNSGIIDIRSIIMKTPVA